MKIWRNSLIGWSAAAALGLCLALPGNAAEDKAKLEIKRPKPAFVGTPKNLSKDFLAQMEKPNTPEPTIMVPKGTKLLSGGKEVTSSDSAPIIGSLDLITDGDKEATDGSWVELGPGKQRIDGVGLGDESAIEQDEVGEVAVLVGVGGDGYGGCCGVGVHGNHATTVGYIRQVPKRANVAHAG